MTIEAALVNDVVHTVAARTINECLISRLRQQFSPVHFTYCMDDDIVSGKPVREENGFNIYLVDGRDHCLCLTNDPDKATGIVVAEVLEDEE